MKKPVVITYQGKVICNAKMTVREVDKFVKGMQSKGYEMEVTYK